MTVNHWCNVVLEQINTLIDSGLYDTVDAIYVGVVGDVDAVLALLKPYRKIYQAHHTTNHHAYEFGTLWAMQQMAASGQQFEALYMHTKGVSYCDAQMGAVWRRHMARHLITAWQQCRVHLKDNDLVSVNWREATEQYPAHFSGNFFWTTAKYLRRLPCIMALDTANRFNAEFWPAMGAPKALSMSQAFVNNFTKTPPKDVEHLHHVL